MTQFQLPFDMDEQLKKIDDKLSQLDYVIDKLEPLELKFETFLELKFISRPGTEDHREGGFSSQCQ